MIFLICSGVDIPALMESVNISETIIAKVKNSSMGHFAIAYLLYKICTPIRYTVTLGKQFYLNNSILVHAMHI